jgi:hypothetical protein
MKPLYPSSEHNTSDLTMMAIHNERNVCFLVAITHTEVEDARVICAQAVLYNSTNNDDCNLYYAVCEVPAQIVHSCLCDPREEVYKSVSQYSMQSHADQAATCLRTYVFSRHKSCTSGGGITSVMGIVDTFQTIWFSNRE